MQRAELFRQEESYRLQTNTRKAIASLNDYLDKPEEAILRAHQMDVFSSLRDFLKEGGTAGYIDLPSGYGKTHVALEIAQATGLKTLILSPTQQILRQTHQKASMTRPELTVSNYYTGEKDLSGHVLNTTYHSVQRLIAERKIDPSEFGLVIADEAHTALGNVRHTIYQHFYNALMIGLTATPYFKPIEGYETRGIVRPTERWTGMFKKQIHEMTLEEGMEREILTPLDIRLISTNVRVPNIQLESNGEYNQKDLDRLLNIEIRNRIALALIVGPQALAGLQLSDSQLKEVTNLYEQIKDKKKTIFGINIAHIEYLKEELQQYGVDALTVHSKLKPGDVTDNIELYEQTNVNNLLGVAMLRIGWDSPSTEVGIFLAPTRSAIVAKQEVGRLLRPSPETGKQEAVAIQLVDNFVKYNQSPIVIPSLFDPYFVMRGSRTGLEEPNKSSTYEPKVQPKVRILGADADLFMKKISSQGILSQRFRQSSVREINSTVNDLIDIVNAEEKVSMYELMKRVAERLPERLTAETYEIVRQSLASLDNNTVKEGVKAIFYLNLRSVLDAVMPYESDNQEANEELFMAVFHNLTEKMKTLRDVKYLNNSIYEYIKKSVPLILGSELNMPPEWINPETYPILKELYETLHFTRKPRSTAEIQRLANDISEETQIPEKMIARYIIGISNSKIEEPKSPYEEASAELLKDELRDVLNKLPETDRSILIYRHGLRDGQEHTLHETAVYIGVTPERIRQREIRTFRKLRLNRYGAIALQQFFEEPTVYSSQNATEKTPINMIEFTDKYLGLCYQTDGKLEVIDFNRVFSDRRYLTDLKISFIRKLSKIYYDNKPEIKLRKNFTSELNQAIYNYLLRQPLSEDDKKRYEQLEQGQHTVELIQELIESTDIKAFEKTINTLNFLIDTIDLYFLLPKKQNQE